MPVDPTQIISEVLGKPARLNYKPSRDQYLCPYLNSKCVKRSTKLGLEPYPNCSVLKKIRNETVPICVCPKRFYEIDLFNDVISHCWKGSPPQNPQVAREVKMAGFGNVDFVIADLSSSGSINNFLSVELQSIDITGSVMPAYEALMEGRSLEKKPTFGLNWDNVYKRYITQLIRKGYYHHHWKTKIVAVMQDVVYDYICDRASFMRSNDVLTQDVNIIFMSYKYSLDSSGSQVLTLDKVEGTSHANLQQAFMYKEAPSRDAFCEQIKQSLSRKQS